MPLETEGKRPNQGWILALCIALVIICAAAAAAVVWLGSRNALPTEPIESTRPSTTQTVPTTAPTEPTTEPTIRL